MGCSCSSNSGEDFADDNADKVELKKKKYSSKLTATAATERKKSKKQPKTTKPTTQQQKPTSHQKKSSRQQPISAEGGRSRTKNRTSAGSKETSAVTAPTKKKDKGGKRGRSSCFGSQLKPVQVNLSKVGVCPTTTTMVSSAPTNTFSSAFNNTTTAPKGGGKSSIKQPPPINKVKNYNANTSTSLANYTFKSDKVNALDELKDVQSVRTALAKRRLGRDQSLRKTVVGGKDVSLSTDGSLMTRKEVEELNQNLPLDLPDIALLLTPDFTAMHLIVPGIYLTGSFGLQREAFAEASVLVVINATIELPMLSPKGDGASLLTYRVPVDDDAEHRISDYFDDVADLMETARRRGYGSVVHCVAGVSRSTTLVLAYLLKYTDMSLHQAFSHTKAIRTQVRPNMGFLHQLISYEAKVQPGRSSSPSVRMVSISDSRHGVTVTVPDFYPIEFPNLYEWEINKAVAMQKLAASAGTSTSASSSSSSHARK